MTRSTKTRLALLFAVSLAPALLRSASPSEVNLAPPAMEPPTTGGAAVVDRALAKLSTHKRLLVIAAHPDDEDTSLLTLVSRGLGGEAAYLALSRGEGGQNLIGPELGPGLGLIRTRELLAARGIDGGRQFFSRAYDFGYTTSLDETLKLWPKDVLIEDAVRVIRRFKPQVIVSVFPGVPSPTHGQHQAAGVTAFAAFPLAGDPQALPQLAAEGLTPWTPQALYRSAFFDRKSATETLPLSGVDPFAGKSIFQLAMLSRSMHRSQDMGNLQDLGPRDSAVLWVQGGAGQEGKDLFAGIDTRLSAIAATLPDAGRRGRMATHLDAAQAAAEGARKAFNPERPEETVPAFLEILKHLRAAQAEAQTTPEERPAADLIAEKLQVAATGLAAAAGIGIDAATDAEALTPGQTFKVHAVLWNSGGRALTGTAVSLVPSADWGGAPVSGEKKDAAAGALSAWDLQPAVPAGTAPPTPDLLRRPLNGAVYDWSQAAPEVRGEPFEPAPLVARFELSVDGVPVTLDREVVHRHRDQAVGEVRRPLRVVPRVEVAVAEHLLVWPASRHEPRHLQVTVTSHAASAVKGHLEAAVEGGTKPWPVIRRLPFTLGAGEDQTLDLAVAPPAALGAGRYNLKLAAVLDEQKGDGPKGDGQNGDERFDLAVPVIDYPHIRPTPQPQPAAVAISAADIKLPPLKRVGYVRGASDRVPEFLRQAGVPLELLGPKDLAEGDLGRYDAIVLGSRAYETDPALVKANRRLLDYARNGGLVIVQYQQYPFIEGKLAPFALDIARPHDRITDETAAVTLLDPASPLFHTPNEIGAEDWNGWVQERGLYFAHTWDASYVPLLSMADPGGSPLKGGLLVAPLGKGHYVYTGLAFFRQLPAGVPGAYRLFANLLALGRNAPAKITNTANTAKK
jgi:LmbE family N-acetylglucosaminyl deacetylase